MVNKLLTCASAGQGPQWWCLPTLTPPTHMGEFLSNTIMLTAPAESGLLLACPERLCFQEIKGWKLTPWGSSTYKVHVLLTCLTNTETDKNSQNRWTNRKITCVIHNMCQKHTYSYDAVIEDPSTKWINPRWLLDSFLGIYAQAPQGTDQKWERK